MKNTKQLVINSLLIAIVFIATFIAPIPMPGTEGGLIHLGNIALFIIAIVYGKKNGAIAAAFGMTIFDLFAGYTMWAPATFVIRLVMGYFVGVIAHANGKDGKSFIYNSTAMILTGVWCIVGYFLFFAFIIGEFEAAWIAIPGDIIQIVIGIIFALPAITMMNKSGMTDRLRKNAI